MRVLLMLFLMPTSFSKLLHRKGTEYEYPQYHYQSKDYYKIENQQENYRPGDQEENYRPLPTRVRKDKEFVPSAYDEAPSMFNWRLRDPDDLNIWLRSYQNRLRKLQLQKQRKVGRFNRNEENNR